VNAQRQIFRNIYQFDRVVTDREAHVDSLNVSQIRICAPLYIQRIDAMKSVDRWMREVRNLAEIRGS